MTTFSRAAITIATDPPTEVQAMVRGGLAVHGSAGLYTVTHIASGRAVCHSDQQRTAKGVVVELLELLARGGGWERAEIPDEQLHYVHKAVKGYYPKAPVSIKPIVAPPLELEPIYPAYFTPSEGLVALDRQIAGGDFGRIADASAAEWRELIMVRMGTGKQAVLLDKDIPERKPQVYPLPPGIAEGYAGVKQLTQQMWKLGQAIDSQAKKMNDLFGLRGKVSEWHVANFTDWMAMDSLLSEMIRHGWCDWAICVTLFATLSKAEQQKITAVLGFVGSDEQGWVAYGKKTFLRSKRLVELTECRRAVQAALNG